MTPSSIRLPILVFCALCAACSETQSRPLPAPQNLTIEVLDSPSAPLVSATLSPLGDALMVTGEVRSRASIPLNGYVSIDAIDATGRLLWSNTAVLLRSGPKFFGYRVFSKEIPQMPPPGTKIIVEFHKEA